MAKMCSRDLAPLGVKLFSCYLGAVMCVSPSTILIQRDQKSPEVISTTSGLKMAASEFSLCHSVGVLRSLYVIKKLLTLLHSLVVGGGVISGFFSAVLN